MNGPRRRPVSRVLRTALAATILVIAAASPASAHTALTSSTPAHRSVLEAAPATVELRFSSPVDPRWVSAEVVDASGARHPGVATATTGAPTTAITVALPPLDEGLYGLAWQSLGGDGHRVAGEVLFGVGPTATADFGSVALGGTSLADRALDVAAGVGRFAWYTALSLLAGALFLSGWAARALRPEVHDRQLARLDARNGTHADQSPRARLREAAATWRQRAFTLAIGAAALRLAVGVAVLASGVDRGGLPERLGEALTAPTSLLWLGVLAVLVVLRVRQVGQGLALAGFGITVGLSAFTGHALTDPDPLLAGVFTALHLGAAAAWVGPLAVISLVVVSPAWRAEPAAGRRSALAGCFRRYARVAGWAFAALAASGLRLATTNLGDDLLSLGTLSSYRAVLAVKVGIIVAVAVPLGLAHHRVASKLRPTSPPSVGTRPTSPPSVGTPALLTPRFLTTVRLEATVLVGLLALAAGLTGLPPEATAGQPANPAAALAAPDQVTDVAECSALTLGKPDCYRAYFTTVMQSDGATAAVAEVEALSATDDFVAADCHQITHDLGNDAADYYPTLGEALGQGGAACWSGYYHGVVEARLSEVPDDRLAAEVPSLCDEAATERYSFTHYNCMHGLGHGLMLRTGADLFGSLDTCATLAEDWETQSCAGGVFMQNVIAAQHGEPAEVAADDVLYPCTAVTDRFSEQCYLMQTSHALWSLDYDYAAVFALCDGVGGGRDATCYQSMGRDISGNALLDPGTVVKHCDLGAEALRGRCIYGAVQNAVYDQHGHEAADALCAMVDPQYLATCEEGRDAALASF